MTQQITYYAVVGEGPFIEVLVTRAPNPQPNTGARLVSQEPTGVTYPTWREAIKALEAKNRST